MQEQFAYFSLGGTKPLRFAIYAAVTVNITVLWTVTTCTSVDRHQRLWATRCVRLYFIC